MIKKLYLFFLVAFSLYYKVGFTQSVQWADKVISFSSQLTPLQYSADQALGKPNVLPAGGQNPNAWTPDKPKRSEYIKLGYSNPIQIQQIAVAESYNPGALLRIFLYDESDNEHLVHTFNPMVVPLEGRMLNIFVEKTIYKVRAVKLEFDGTVLPDYFSLDALAISDSHFPIIANIDVPELMSKGLAVEPLEGSVNSEYNELNPLLSPDGKTLYFSRRNHPENVGGANDKEDIWYSELGTDGKWSLAKNMGNDFNNDKPNFLNTVSTTPDGQVALLLGNRYLEKGKMAAGVSISTYEAGKWTAPKPLEIENDYNFSDKANYFMTNTHKALLMSVERGDSRGGRDLYVSFNKEADKWTEPLNLGRMTNTAGEESAPFLASDNTTLYFSSNGFSGYGGRDIYMSKRLDDTWTNWSMPENMGPAINTKHDDLFFNIPQSSEYAYYSRSINSTNADLFRVKLPVAQSPDPVVVIKGKLIDSKTSKPIAAKIIFERLPGGEQAGITYSNAETGDYEVRLPGGYRYGFRAVAIGHISENQTLDLSDFKKDGSLEHKDISLTPIEENATVTLNNVFFAFDKAILAPESCLELDRIVKLMNEQSSMHIEIAGHTDAIGTEVYNLELSERRARSVTSYLVKNGIAADRIKTTYFGESQLLDYSNTSEGDQKNRRVEFKIITL